MVPYLRTRFFRGATGSYAGGCRLLLVSPPDRTAMLRPGPEFIPRLSSTGQALYFLRGRGSETPPSGFRLAALSDIASAPGGDPPRDSSAVHHWNPPRRTAGSDARRLQSAGIDPAHSRDQVL